VAIEFGKTPFVAFVSFCYSRILQALNRTRRLRCRGRACAHKDGSQESIANWRNDETVDRGVRIRQCPLDTASVCAIGNVKFCSNFLLCQRNQSISTDWLLQNHGVFPASDRRRSHLCGCLCRPGRLLSVNGRLWLGASPNDTFPLARDAALRALEIGRVSIAAGAFEKRLPPEGIVDVPLNGLIKSFLEIAPRFPVQFPLRE
jgi:hypothetical protein